MVTYLFSNEGLRTWLQMTTADGGRPDSYTFAVGTELALTTSGGDSCGEIFGIVERGVNERAR